VDAGKRRIGVALAGTPLAVDGLLLAEDAKVWLDGHPGRLSDLSAGMAVALQVAAEGGQRRIVGVRAGKSRVASQAAGIARLIGQLGSVKFDEREAASKALAALGRPARQALTRATRSGDAEVRTRARRLLKALANEEDTWYFSANHAAKPDLTKRCSVVEVGGKTYCANEKGEKSQATVSVHRDHLEVHTLEWGLKGRIEIDKEGTRIKWANGTKWTRKRP
jgi:hypothetical protein